MLAGLSWKRNSVKNCNEIFTSCWSREPFTLLWQKNLDFWGLYSNSPLVPQSERSKEGTHRGQGIHTPAPHLARLPPGKAARADSRELWASSCSQAEISGQPSVEVREKEIFPRLVKERSLFYKQDQWLAWWLRMKLWLWPSRLKSWRKHGTAVWPWENSLTSLCFGSLV